MKTKRLLKRGIAAVLRAGTSVVAAPFVLGAVGFGSVGIAAGSYAASMMSAAAVANVGGVAAGSLVALAQSAGMAGLSTAVTAAVDTIREALVSSVAAIFN